MRKKYPSDITKEQFEQLRSILESGRKKTVPRKVDLSEVILRHTVSVEKRLPTAYAVWSYFKYGKLFTDGVKALLGEQIDVSVVKRNEMHTFKVIPKQWVVERSFVWLEKHRRLWKNCERKYNTALQFMILTSVAPLLRTLTMCLVECLALPCKNIRIYIKSRYEACSDYWCFSDFSGIS